MLIYHNYWEFKTQTWHFMDCLSPVQTADTNQRQFYCLELNTLPALDIQVLKDKGNIILF